MSFKPTYKGWKRGFTITSSGSPASVLSLPTRDGNFPFPQAHIPALYSFKPTYKGWKLEELYLDNGKDFVLSLPTRDGNAPA